MNDLKFIGLSLYNDGTLKEYGVEMIGARTESGDVPTSVMETAGENQYAVHVEWVDPHSQLLRRFHLKFFEVDSTLEIFDTRAKK